jgi:predicted dehydrogenase
LLHFGLIRIGWEILEHGRRAGRRAPFELVRVPVTLSSEVQRRVQSRPFRRSDAWIQGKKHAENLVKETIKCGVLGAGWWATYAHIPALLSHPRAELVAIQKTNIDQARKVAADFGVPRACTSTSELLSIDGLQAVVVSSSAYLHHEQAACALRMGKHVLIEKPMTLTVAQARELLDLADERNLQFIISCPWHYTAHAAAAQSLIRDGRLGQLRMISVLMTNPVSHLLRGQNTIPTHRPEIFYLDPNIGTYSDPKIAGGGQIYTQVCHVAAYLTFLTGFSASEVFARFHNDGAVLDIYDSLNIRMEDGTLVNIASTGATSLNLRTYEVRIFGTDGMLYLDLWRGTMELTSMNGNKQIFPNLSSKEIYPHQAPAINLIDSILEPSCNRSPASLGMAAIGMIEAACVSAKSGQNVFVPSLMGQEV